MKRIVTIQDISCIGKCSLTVALPIISAMGVETAVLPTAVLSAHTAFNRFTFHDLTDDIDTISAYWHQDGLTFDAIYTGYLGSFEQLELMSNFFDRHAQSNTLIFVDPVMGDNGNLYHGFTAEFAAQMATLCAKADIIVPNMTEAAYLLGIPYVGTGYDETYVKEILKQLCALGTKKAVLTGVSFDDASVGVMAYDSEADRFFSYFREKIAVSYHGTGDVFASTCVGALMNDFSLEEALQIATDYTVECIHATEADESHVWYGVNFESVIPYLVHRLEK